LAGIESKLLFILVYVKTYPLQTMHGLQFGLSQAQTNEWIHRYRLMPVLREAMNAQGMTPQRPDAPARRQSGAVRCSQVQSGVDPSSDGR
jgi:hypothetical protein